jgi:hypothetical protein
MTEVPADKEDGAVLGKIDAFVHEEQQLYATSNYRITTGSDWRR